jgi:hypothetical protein
MKDSDRRTRLLQAEKQAESLFGEIEKSKIVAPGCTEREAEQAIYALAEQMFGVRKHWHKRIVRAGPNTLTIASDNPPVREIATDDIVYVDLGPVFEEWEADIGRTYVIGDDPAKLSLVDDLPATFHDVQTHYNTNRDISGAELYTFAQKAAEKRGWQFGGVIAGHIVSEFAHARIPGDKDLNRIGPRNPRPMSDLDTLGRPRHWILEIHLVDSNRGFGGFYERLL